ncbi:MAG: M42 family metallopeptidase [Clostridiales bacterium]|nr:M42 family metallopeptidase [Clostridiales bacterium]
MLNTLKKLIKISGVSGREHNLAEFIKTLLADYCDRIERDTLGNLIAFKRGTAEKPKKVMLAAHMDEIGFMTTFIEDSGLIRFGTIGGINFNAAAYSEVVFEQGIKGVLIPDKSVAPADYKATKFYVDIGARNKKEAERRVKIGDCFSLSPSLIRLCGERIAGRPFDDRIGCAILIDIAKKLKSCPDDVYFVFTVQEEVGCRGSKTAAFTIAPDYAIAYDVTSTGDMPGADPMAIKVGEGAAIKIKDASVICDNRLVSLMQKTAKENKIPFQNEILTAGGTDTSSMQVAGNGAVAGALSVPTRYIHSGVELLDIKDAKACSALTLALLANGLD